MNQLLRLPLLKYTHRTKNTYVKKNKYNNNNNNNNNKKKNSIILPPQEKKVSTATVKE